MIERLVVLHEVERGREEVRRGEARMAQIKAEAREIVAGAFAAAGVG